MMGKWYSENYGDLKVFDIYLTGEVNPRKNSAQETCPDRGRLRDRRACYRLLHRGGRLQVISSYINLVHDDYDDDDDYNGEAEINGKKLEIKVTN